MVFLVPSTDSTISLDLLIDVLEPLLNHIVILVNLLRLAVALVSAHIHCIAVSVSAVLHFVNLSSRRSLVILTMHRRLLHHHLVFVLLVLVLEVAPLCQDFHGLNVFDSRQLLSVVFVATKSVQINFFAETFVLVLHHFEDVVDLLAVEYFFVVHTGD